MNVFKREMLNQLWETAQRYYQDWTEPIHLEVPRKLYVRVGSQMVEAEEPYSFSVHHTFYFYIPKTERMMDYEYTVLVDSLKKELYRKTYRHCGTQAVVVPFSSEYLDHIPQSDEGIAIRVVVNLQEKKTLNCFIKR